jgi:thioredoxin-dependent peroxiredoxin
MAAKKQTVTAKTSPKAKPASPVANKPTKPVAKSAKLTPPAKPAQGLDAVKQSKAAALIKAAKAAKAVAPIKAAKAVKVVAPIKSAKATKVASPVKAAKATKAVVPVKATSAVKPARAPTSVNDDGTPLDAGSTAPSFELTDESGASVSSSSLAGKPYLLYFYPKDDTPGCTKEACDIRDNFGRFGKQGLRVLGVSPDSQQSHAKFGKKYGLPFTLLSDPDKTLASAYGVWGEKNNYGKKYMGIIRSSFLIGADGLVKKVYRGVKVNGHVDAVLTDAQAVL